ncbi:MAG: CBS domain-containing protein, partial [Gemmataceae bacterium]
EYLDELIERMTRTNVAHTAVVSRTDQRLVGYVSWRDLLRARSRTKAEETQRVAFYRVAR